MSKFPPKKPTKKQIEFANKLYMPQPVLSTDEIKALPDDPTPKQRKKRVELESKRHGHFVQEFGKRWPDVYVFSIRDERGMYKEGERNKQRGKKRPDIFITKTKLVTFEDSCKCSEPLFYSTLNEYCLRCNGKLPFNNEVFFAGLFIEMKSDRSKYLRKDGKIRQSEHIQGQLATLMKLRKKGYAAYFAGDEAEAMTIAEWYMEGEGGCPYEYLYTGCPNCQGTEFYHCKGCDYVYCENCKIDIIHGACGECIPF